MNKFLRSFTQRLSLSASTRGRIPASSPSSSSHHEHDEGNHRNFPQMISNKQSISTNIALNPTKLPTLNADDVHQRALDNALSDKVASGKPHMDLDLIRPEKPDFLVTPQAWVKNINGEFTDLIDLEPYFFSCAPRKDILHMMVVWQLAKRRQGTHKTKHRLELAYTKKKMYRQKGTGRARHADRGAPQFRGGGHAHPRRPRDYSFKLNKRVRRLALRMALTTKLQQGKLLILEDFHVEVPKTRIVNNHLKNLGVGEGGVLMIDGAEVTPEFERGASNLKHVDVLPSAGINVYDILRHDTLVLSREALEDLKAHYEEYIKFNE